MAFDRVGLSSEGRSVLSVLSGCLRCLVIQATRPVRLRVTPSPELHSLTMLFRTERVREQ